MHYQILPANLSEPFQKAMQQSGWTITKQDAGQAHIVGWGYFIEWQQAGNSVSLEYRDIQGRAEAQLAISPGAWPQIEALLKTLL